MEESICDFPGSSVL